MPEIELRTPTDDDWPAIARVANLALPHAADGNAEWLANRREFAASGQSGRHHVAVERGGRIVAYAAIEEDAAGRYRLFAVTDPRRLAGDIGALLWNQTVR